MADTTITGLTAASTVAGAEVLPIDQSGATVKVTIANLAPGLPAMVGDSGSGGTKGLVPAPPAGAAAAGKFLKADGTFAVPSASLSTLTTKGDLLTYNAGLARLGVGTNGSVLTADSGQTLGIKWAPSAGISGKKPIQDKATGTAGTNTNSLAITLGSTPTNGNLLIACIDRDATGVINSITQTGVTWTQLLTTGTGTAPVVEIWKGVVGSGAGTTLTIACSTTTFTGAHVSEWNGITGTIDQSATVSGAGATSAGPRTPILLPTNASALVIGACSTIANSTAYREMRGMVTFDDMLATASTCATGFAFPGTVPIRGIAGVNVQTYSGAIVSLT